MVDQTSICEKLTPMLDAFYDGELSNEDNLTVCTHIKDCLACRDRLHEIETTVGLLKGLPRLQMPRELVINWQPLIKQGMLSGGATNKSSLEGNIVPIRRDFKQSFVLAIAATVTLLILASSFLFLSINNREEKEIVIGAANKEQIRSKEALSSQPVNEGDLLALYQNESKPISEELGIATNEDGLYALKL